MPSSPLRALSNLLVRGSLAAAFAAIVLLTTPTVGHAQTNPCTTPVTNQVACENTKAGAAPATWTVPGNGDASIQGYATAMSVKAGDREDFKIKTDSANYHVDIYRMGYYAGNGARLIQGNLRPTVSLPQTQPACVPDATTGLIDCGGWATSVSWTVPAGAVSGVYMARLVRDDRAGVNQIVFVVRDDASTSDVLVSTSDASWQAYNDYGGNSLYTCTTSCPVGNPKAYKAAYAVSYNRPMNAGSDGGRTNFFYAEYQLIRWLERNGYNASYVSSFDVDARGPLLKNHKIFVSSAHDEYWSANQRANVEAARDAGVNLAFFSGNEVFWKTRFAASSASGSSVAGRTLITYKDTHFDAPTDPVEWTGAWDDTRFTTPTQKWDSQNLLTGQLFVVNSGSGDITVPARFAKLRFWRNTAAARLTGSQTLTLDPNGQTLGYEWDVDVDNGARPTGLFQLSSTTMTNVESFTDYGSTTKFNTTATHNLTLYRAPSGALVFGAGTVQWAWGLDNANPTGNAVVDPANTPPDVNMQQATLNLFADMKVQPRTIQTGLVAASASTDTTKPSTTISSPAANANLQDGAKITISGTASDSGGTVAGVEVSTDNGVTWHPATGTTSWTYSWTVHGAPKATIKTRAIDDTGNIQTPGAGTTVNVACACTLWGTDAPPTVDSGDTSSLELGLKFTTDVFGVVSGVRFYKAATNTGTHVGSLWTIDGQRLATATFTNETASGWQQVTFANPVAISPGTTYVVSYFAPNGHYSMSGGDFFNRNPWNATSRAASPPLRAVIADGVTKNGVYSYGAVPTFPTASYDARNYYVDVVFAPAAAPGTVTNVTATADSGGATVSWTAPATGGPVTSYKITPYIGSTAQTAVTVTGSPVPTTASVTGLSPNSTYTFKVQAINPTGAGTLSAASNAVRPLDPRAPSVPLNVEASAASTSAQVRWTAPVSSGGAAISGYTITPYIGTTAQTAIQVAGDVTSFVVPNLTNGTDYRFTVTAKNSIMAGGASPQTNAVTPYATIFDFAVPASVDAGDTAATVLGVKFKSDTTGQITGVRFYKAAGNTGTHVGSLWSATGTRLAQATFTSETSSGWQQVKFATPVTVTAGTTYVASYSAPNGHYSLTAAGFRPLGVDNGVLHALADDVSPNGVYAYGDSTAFPALTFNGGNYWVDVTYAPPPAPGATGTPTATAGNGSATVKWTAPTTGGAPTTYTVTPYKAGVAQTPVTVTGEPPALQVVVGGLTPGTAYTFRVQASNSGGSGPLSSASSAVTPTLGAPSAVTSVAAEAADGTARLTWTAPATDGGAALTSYIVTPYIGTTAQTATTVAAPATGTTITGLQNGTLYTFKVKAKNSSNTGVDSAASNAVMPDKTLLEYGTPASLDSGDRGAVTVGVKLRADDDGLIHGIRFYKGAANTGTHVGSLWDAAGTLLAQATFANETATGWQQVVFATPVAITAGTTYVAGYLAPTGGYSLDAGGLAAGIDRAPLHALAHSAGGNGVFSYGAASTFPTSSYNGGNYWVDVLYGKEAAPGATGTPTVTAGNGSVTVKWTAPTTGGAPATYTVTPYKAGVAQTPVTVTGTPPATQVVVGGLTPGTAYTFRVQASNSGGSGPLSAASAAATPTLGAPSAVNAVEAEAADASARLSWKAPDTDGGAAIASYIVTPYRGTTAQATTTVTAPATGTTITGLTNGAKYTFKVKAKNSGFTGPDSAASNAVMPDQTLFEYATPAILDSGDRGSVTVGVKLKSDADGFIHGIRFYKGAANTGTHVGSLWSATGELLAQATFTAETSGGWQQVVFATPVAVTAGTTYVAGYLAPNGGYSMDAGGLTSGFDRAPLHAIVDPLGGNGVFSYGAASVFPTSTYNGGNYWVDVLYGATAPLTAPGTPGTPTATAGIESATVSWTAPATGGAVAEYTVTPYAGTTAQTPVKVAGTATSATVTGLTAGTAYTFKVQASNAAGDGPLSAASNAVTPAANSPGAPTDVRAVAGIGTATVSWTPPTTGGVVTKYTVTPYSGSTALPSVTVTGTPPATSTTVTGLTAGTSYTFKVRASNASGDGPLSAASNAVTPLVQEPGTATNVTAVAGVGSATVSWAAPTTGGAVTKYTVTPYIGTVAQTPVYLTGTPPGTSTTVTGLTAGTAYTFKVLAANSTGISAASAASNAVTPTAALAVPGAVGTPTATAGVGSATVSWTAPASGGAVTKYTVTPYLGSTAQTPVTLTGTPPARTVTVYNLTAGLSYTFKVRASNATGDGPLSAASNTVRPTLGPATAPTNLEVESADGSATLHWTLPVNNGGDEIFNYRVTPYRDGVQQTGWILNVGQGQKTDTTVTLLTNGSNYTFKVAAETVDGDVGAYSAMSHVVIPGKTLFEYTTPQMPDSGDRNAGTLGMKFKADAAGKIYGIRFYKGPANTGTHVGSLWSSTGTLLAQATATEISGGWVSARFATPVSITAGTTYVAGYFAPNGGYSVTTGGLTAGFDRSPLHALAAPNGLRSSGSASAFPTTSTGANYWVDVLYK